jgi:putative FmdB family regulatory protein
MPIFRFGCECGQETEDLRSFGDSGTPSCPQCSKAMTRLMPNRVSGRVAPDSNGVHSGSGFAKISQSEFGLEVASARPKNRETKFSEGSDFSPGVPAPKPTGVFAKAYDDCSASEKDARWADSAQALSAFTAEKLESKGETPAQARAKANEASVALINKSRATTTMEGATP